MTARAKVMGGYLKYVFEMRMLAKVNDEVRGSIQSMP